MKVIGKTSRFATWLESNWSLYLLLKGAGLVGSFALPAWAANAANLFSDYSPFSWVVAGFGGMLISACMYAAYAWAISRINRTRYDAKMMARGAYIDPLAKTYEDLRIFLNEFVLPSHPVIENKTFINCEIIGPANIILQHGNNINEPRWPVSDAVKMKLGGSVYNAVFVRNCMFRQCSFQRITFLVPPSEYDFAKDWDGFNWITEGSPPTIDATSEDDPPRLQPNTVEETPQ